MTIGAIFSPLTAFAAYGAGLNQSAHNLANVLTPGFKAGRVGYSSLPGSSGVRAVELKSGAAGVEAAGGRVPLAETGAPGGPESAFRLDQSNTDVAAEMLNLIVVSRTYQANAATVRTADSMLGMAVNLIV